jgi:acetoin utilization deacetylase AcuC-like enzyme
MRRTAFVNHYDCSRHDTGWQHPDHQGRLPALMRAVYADMLTLFGHLLEVEGRHATREELLTIHSPEYLATVEGWVADAAAREEVLEPVPDIRISAATLDAGRAAVGCALAGVDRVIEGVVDRAFCAVRPAGRYVTRSAPAEFGILNTVATTAVYAARALGSASPDGPGRILVVELGGPAGSPTSDLLSADVARVAGVYREREAHRGTSRVGEFVLRRGAGSSTFARALKGLLEECREEPYGALILSLGFDGLAGDPLGDLGLAPVDYYSATRLVRDFAEEKCGGRLVSILEGGYETRGLGAAAVQHLRALAGVDPIA